jgi:hypothetical protein
MDQKIEDLRFDHDRRAAAAQLTPLDIERTIVERKDHCSSSRNPSRKASSWLRTYRLRIP